MSRQNLGTEPVGKLLLKYSIPAVIGMIVNGLYNVVDRIFIGNIPDVGSLAISGLGVSLPIMTIFVAFGMLTGVGGAANVSIKLGEGKREVAEKVLANALMLAVIIGITLTTISMLFIDEILFAFGASGDSLPFAKEYINTIIYGSTFNILAMTLNNHIRGDGAPKLSAIIMVVGCGMNIVLDALFIFGFEMGIRGAALATVISQTVTAIMGLSYYLKGKSNVRLKKENLKLDKKVIGLIVAIGSAPFAMQLAASTVQVISNNMLKTYGGDLAIGAMATINSVLMMIGMPIMGINQGAQPIIGYNFGAKLYDRSEKTLKISIAVATIGLLIGWSCVMLFSNTIVSVFNPEPELVAISADGIRKYLLCMPLMATSMLSSNYMQSIGKAKQAMFLGLLRQVILLTPLMLILPSFLGLDGVWYSMPIADVLSVTITLIVLMHTIKGYRKQEQLEKEAM